MITKKQIFILRLIRTIVIVIFSIGWIIPLKIGVNEFFIWMYHSHQSDYLESVDSGFRLQLSECFIGIGLAWLAIILAFWVFIIANKLWPPKK